MSRTGTAKGGSGTGRLRTWGANLGLLMAGLAVAGLLGEALVRLHYGAQTGRRRWGPDTVLEGEPYRYDPLVGWRLIPNARARLVGAEFDTEIAVNSQGLRMTRDVPFERSPGRRRILLFGDSFTFGHGVEAGERFGDLLESMLEDVEVVNFGISASGTDQHYLLYREDGVRYDADLVILCYLVNNVQRNAMEFISGRYKPVFVLTDGELELTNVPVPLEPIPPRRGGPSAPEPRGTGIPIPFKTFLREHSELYTFLRARIGNTIHRIARSNPEPFPEYRDGNDAWQVTVALLDRFAEEVRRNGSDFLLVVLPVPEFMYVDHLDDRPFEMTAEAGRKGGYPVLDLLPGLRRAASESGSKLYYELDSHWNPRGHAAAAAVMARYLADRYGWARMRSDDRKEPADRR